MKDIIKKEIEKLDWEAQHRVFKVITAMRNGDCRNIEFYEDGSGVNFTIWSPTINHGLPGVMALSFTMKEAILILAGHRFKSTNLPILGSY